MPFANFDITAILVTGVVFTCLTIIAVVIIIYSMKRRKLEIEAYKTAIEKGIPVPELKLARAPFSTLKAALIWIAIGLGLFILLLAEGGGDGLGVSAIPILIGLALIVSHIIEKKEIKKNKPEPGQ